MISLSLWPHDRAKSATFGDFSGPTIGPLSRYLPERQLWGLLRLIFGSGSKAPDHGGDLETRPKGFGYSEGGDA